jgi:hypothetical protein
LKKNYIKEFKKDDGESKTTEEQVEETVLTDLSSNEFYRLLQVIHGKANLEPLVTGFSNILYNYIEARYTYLPDSVI